MYTGIGASAGIGIGSAVIVKEPIIKQSVMLTLRRRDWQMPLTNVLPRHRQWQMI